MDFQLACTTGYFKKKNYILHCNLLKIPESTQLSWNWSLGHNGKIWTEHFLFHPTVRTKKPGATGENIDLSVQFMIPLMKKKIQGKIEKWLGRPQREEPAENLMFSFFSFTHPVPFAVSAQCDHRIFSQQTAVSPSVGSLVATVVVVLQGLYSAFLWIVLDALLTEETQANTHIKKAVLTNLRVYYYQTTEHKNKACLLKKTKTNSKIPTLALEKISKDG